MPDRALLLGINEYNFAPTLKGCVNDVHIMRGVLTEVFGFEAASIRTHTDAEVTKEVVREGMRWLREGAGPNDRLIFHFSGHGSFVPDQSGDEPRDEIICLVDMDFSNPGSYFLDDELAEFAASIPEGAQLVFVLDCCHSGNGTRNLLLPDSDKRGPKGMTLLDARSTARRAGVEVSAPDFPPDSRRGEEDWVRARFINPPAHIWEAVARTPTPRFGRELVKIVGRDVLLAACRADQTAADALIDGSPQGAFSHHLARVLRDAGPDISRVELISRVEEDLRTARFEQVPQLEAQESQGPLFPSGAVHPQPGVSPTETPPVAKGTDVRQAVAAVLEELDTLSPDDRSRALRVAEKLLTSDAGTGVRTLTGKRRLVAVHGICRHASGFSDPWWRALQPFTQVFGPGRLGEERVEVVWSDLVNPRALELSFGESRRVEHDVVAALLRSALLERAEMLVREEAPALAARDFVRDPFAEDRSLNIPLLNCVDDFTVYLTSDTKRAEIIGRFTAKVRPLLEAGDELDVIAHSWGTVVAYEALRELDALQLPGRVGHFFTVGAALAIGIVKARLRAENRDGRKPVIVSEWYNLDAQGDLVGGRLKGRPFAVDQEFLDLPHVGCSPFDFGCSHGSYFNAQNLKVNRDIFARFINQ